MPDSDSLYHRLFSHPRMVEDLVREFVPGKLTAGFDFRKLQRVNAKFHPNRRPARRREGDVIWRVPARKGESGTPFLYLLIEFQSQSDTWMAARTQVYQGLLWQQVIDEQKLRAGTRLPPLLLLVLYNGQRRWMAATTTSELISLSSDSSLWPWQPQVRYCLLDIGCFPKDALVRLSNLAAFLFRLEQQQTPEEFQEVVNDVIGWFRHHEGYDRLRAIFVELIREACAKHGINLTVLDNLLEENMSLSETFESWEKQWFAEGEAKGEARGKAKGKAEALIALLAGRFGEVAPTWRNQIQGAELATLERWFERAIAAPDLPSVFNSPR